MTAIKTTFAQGRSPWAGLLKQDPPPTMTQPAPTPAKAPRTAPASAPPGVLGLTNDVRVARCQPGRYDAWFDTLKPGDCIKTELAATESLKGYLDRYIKSKRKPWKSTRSLTHPDGCGRIWVVAVGGG